MRRSTRQQQRNIGRQQMESESESDDSQQEEEVTLEQIAMQIDGATAADDDETSADDPLEAFMQVVATGAPPAAARSEKRPRRGDDPSGGERTFMPHRRERDGDDDATAFGDAVVDLATREQEHAVARLDIEMRLELERATRNLYAERADFEYLRVLSGFVNNGDIEGVFDEHALRLRKERARLRIESEFAQRRRALYDDFGLGAVRDLAALRMDARSDFVRMLPTPTQLARDVGADVVPERAVELLRALHLYGAVQMQQRARPEAVAPQLERASASGAEIAALKRNAWTLQWLRALRDRAARIREPLAVLGDAPAAGVGAEDIDDNFANGRAALVRLMQYALVFRLSLIDRVNARDFLVKVLQGAAPGVAYTWNTFLEVLKSRKTQIDTVPLLDEAENGDVFDILRALFGEVSDSTQRDHAVQILGDQLDRDIDAAAKRWFMRVALKLKKIERDATIYHGAEQQPNKVRRRPPPLRERDEPLALSSEITKYNRLIRRQHTLFLQDGAGALLDLLDVRPGVSSSSSSSFSYDGVPKVIYTEPGERYTKREVPTEDRISPQVSGEIDKKTRERLRVAAYFHRATSLMLTADEARTLERDIQTAKREVTMSASPTDRKKTLQVLWRLHEEYEKPVAGFNSLMEYAILRIIELSEKALRGAAPPRAAPAAAADDGTGGGGGGGELPLSTRVVAGERAALQSIVDNAHALRRFLDAQRAKLRHYPVQMLFRRSPSTLTSFAQLVAAHMLSQKLTFQDQYLTKGVPRAQVLMRVEALRRFVRAAHFELRVDDAAAPEADRKYTLVIC